MTQTVAAVVVAAGRGTRLSTPDCGLPKQYRLLSGKRILTRTLEAFLMHPAIGTIVPVIGQDDDALFAEALKEIDTALLPKCLPPVKGGETRQASVFNGLGALKGCEPEFVLIHDAARPMVSTSILDRTIASLASGAEAVLTAIPVVDTLKRFSDSAAPLTTVDRTNLWAAQTPQGFPFKAIFQAHKKANQAGRSDFTDDTGLMEWVGAPVQIIEGEPDNFKITTAGDLGRAERILSMNQTEKQSPPFSTLPDIRFGSGYDVHAFEDGDAVILGGVPIPHNRRLKGHSDADVVLHAITDAILGSIADGDIGAHFPPSDPQWKGAASDQFLIDAIRRVRERGGRLAHIDVTIVCEQPKIGPHRPEIRESIASICDMPIGRISVKATTSERLGFTGRSEGIAAMATATVRLPFSGEDD